MKFGNLGEYSLGLLDFLYKKILNTRLFLALAVIGLFAYCFTQIEATFVTIATANSTITIDSELKGGMVDMPKSVGQALLLIVGFFFMSKASEGSTKQETLKKQEESEEEEEEPLSKLPVVTEPGKINTIAETIETKSDSGIVAETTTSGET